MSGQYQLTGSVKFGTASANVDVSSDVFSCTYKRTHDGIEKPATFGSLRKTTVAGAFADELVVDYVSNNYGASASYLDALVNHAVFTGSQVLYYEFTPDGGAAAPANPKISGTCSVLEWEAGGAVNELRKRSQTFPVLTSAIAVA